MHREELQKLLLAADNVFNKFAMNNNGQMWRLYGPDLAKYYKTPKQVSDTAILVMNNTLTTVCAL